MHLQSHALDDTKRIGPMRQLTTTTGEKGHTILHKDFARTDGRDAEKQVSYSVSSIVFA
jgi:hypothetical protein